MSLLKEFTKKSVVAAVSLAFLGNSIASALVVPTLTESDNGEELVYAMMNGELNDESDLKNPSLKNEGFSGTFINGNDFFSLENGIVLSTTKEYTNFIEVAGAAIANSSVSVHTAENPEKSLEQNSEQPVNEKVEMSGSIKNFNAGPDDLENSVEKTKLEFDINPKVKKIISFKCVFATQEAIPVEGTGGVTTPDFNEDEGNHNDTFGIWVNGENKALFYKDGVPKNITVESVVESGKFKYKKELGGYSITFPFMTEPMEFQAEVEPNKDNHIKLAISGGRINNADLNDTGGNSAVFLNAQMTDAPIIPSEDLLETPEITDTPLTTTTTEQPKEVPENPKTSDINLPIIAMSTLASVSGLVVLVNKYRRINEKA